MLKRLAVVLAAWVLRGTTSMSELLLPTSSSSGESLGHATATPTPTVEGVELEAFRAKVSDANREVRQRVLSTFLSSILLLILLEIGLNFEVFEGGSIAWDRIQLNTGITVTDATVIVVGLTTVVAALSIALVQQQPGKSTDEFAAASVWAKQTIQMSLVVSIVALVTAFTQIVAPEDERRPAVAAALVVVGLVAVVLTAAVTNWSGRALQGREELRNLISSLRSNMPSLEGGGRSQEGTKRPYARFLLVNSLWTTAAAVLVGLTLELFTRLDLRWILLLLLVPTLCIISSWGLVSLTVAVWLQKMRPGRINQLAAGFLRLSYLTAVTLMFAGLFAGGLTRTDSPQTALLLALFWVLWWAGSLIAPAIFLLVARVRQSGPAVFAVQRQILAGQKALQGLEDRLAART